MACECPKCRKAIRKVRVKLAIGAAAVVSIAALYALAPRVAALWR